MAFFSLGGGGVGLNAHVTWVQAGHQTLDSAPFARRVPALEDDRQGRAEPAIADKPSRHQAELEQAAP